MNGQQSSNDFHLYRFGEFQLDTRNAALLRDGKMVPITPKMYDVLLLLVQNSDRILTKAEILDAAWSDTVVEESNLAVTIRHLRKALGDDAHNSSYIQTIARRGYRFVADVEEANPEKPVEHPRPFVLFTLGAVLVLSLMVLAFVWFTEKPLRLGGQEPQRLTSHGRIVIAAVSPDARTLVFAREEIGGESLWKRDLTSGSEQQMLPAAAVSFVGLTIAPTSDYVYYSVFAENAVESKFARIALAIGTPEPMPEIASDVSVSFSPDGSRFAYTESRGAVKETLLKIANVDGSQSRTLLTAKGERRVLPTFRASPVAWSPDDKIACSVQEADESGVYYRIVIVDPEDGSERYLSDKRWDFIESVVWKDTEHLAITNLEPNSPGREIWLISKSNGEARRLNANSKEYEWLSAAGGNLFAVEKDAYSSICIADFPDGLTTAAQVKQIFNDRGYIENIDWYNDKIFYNSWASGKNEIWQVDPDGTNPKQLTSNSNLTLGFTISPIDGTIVFTGTQKAADSLFVADADGKNPRQLTFGSFDSHPKFMPDGKEVIYQYGSIVQPTIWKTTISGDQPAKQITGYRANAPRVSPDGKLIAYQFMDLVSGRQTWRLGLMDSATGALVKTIDFPFLITNRSVAWRPGDNLLTMAITNGATSGLIFVSPTDGTEKTLENVTSEKIAAFVWSPDGKRLAFAANQVTSDVVMLRDQLIAHKRSPLEYRRLDQIER